MDIDAQKRCEGILEFFDDIPVVAKFSDPTSNEVNDYFDEKEIRSFIFDQNSSRAMEFIFDMLILGWSVEPFWYSRQSGLYRKALKFTVL
jgi:hypothetical protein